MLCEDATITGSIPPMILFLLSVGRIAVLPLGELGLHFHSLRGCNILKDYGSHRLYTVQRS
jgi:hypothetical protein